jgi:hypothetical protein
MTALYDDNQSIIASLQDDKIITKYGEELRIVDGDELHHADAGHVGFLIAGDVVNLDRKRVASPMKDWAKL